MDMSDIESAHESTALRGELRVNELMTLGSKVPSRAAIVLPKLFLLQTAQLFLNQIQREGAVNRAFFNVDLAMQWLQESIG